MFELFASNRVQRIGFFTLFLAMIAFDYAKSPIEKFIVHQSDANAAILMAPTTSPRPVDTGPPVTVNSHASQHKINPIRGNEPDMSNVLAVAKSLKDMQLEAKRQGREITRAEMEASVLGTLATKNLTAEQSTAAADKDFFDTFLMVAILGMSGITFIMVIWMATGRIRDIGWSQWIAVAILSSYFAPLIFFRYLPEWLLKASNPTFLILMILIGLIPSRDTDQRFRLMPGGAPKAQPLPQYSTSRRSQFGQRGR